MYVFCCIKAYVPQIEVQICEMGDVADEDGSTDQWRIIWYCAWFQWELDGRKQGGKIPGELQKFNQIRMLKSMSCLDLATIGSGLLSLIIFNVQKDVLKKIDANWW